MVNANHPGSSLPRKHLRSSIYCAYSALSSKRDVECSMPCTHIACCIICRSCSFSRCSCRMRRTNSVSTIDRSNTGCVWWPICVPNSTPIAQMPAAIDLHRFAHPAYEHQLQSLPTHSALPVPLGEKPQVHRR
ncbi:hypothetical protein DL89DRAFT_112087 [Linderina pennispora]|uniref:Uncharacterized protein n=1 Tax=Linderina pennispora TaxID=61395 RepID=A0A1Y1WFJ1_9FUNG|nr:uncharacterized protein DL89DRAFT_112087 [Linderina pennispora]ORX72331.1 hypothetical protein DL89DRAFT_112087 [Linderina pennispora]